jgi:threonine/homoserine/homoserine lactone efflux protein
LSVSPEKRLAVQGLASGSWQGLLTIPGMVAVITSVLVGATVGVLVAVVSDHSLTAALAIGGVATVATLCGLWRRGQAERKRQTSMEELSPYA